VPAPAAPAAPPPAAPSAPAGGREVGAGRLTIGEVVAGGRASARTPDREEPRVSPRGCVPATVLRATGAASWGLCDHATAPDRTVGTAALRRVTWSRRLRRLRRVVLCARCDRTGVRAADPTCTGCGAVVVTIAG
jgi:hypothetical protein